VTAFRRRPPTLPRAAFWVIGAAIAFTGAIAARLLAERLSGDYQLLIWLAGAAVIFLGVAVLSLGTRSHLDGDESDQ
jgi:cytochrome c biogenesis protein CcdA